MSDRALLEDAARAAGLEIVYWAQENYAVVRDGDRNVGWAPLIFNSDAFRLAVRLRLDVLHAEEMVIVEGASVRVVENYLDDPESATRRAITRAAAEIWRTRNERS